MNPEMHNPAPTTPPHPLNLMPQAGGLGPLGAINAQDNIIPDFSTQAPGFSFFGNRTPIANARRANAAPESIASPKRK